MKNIGLCVVFLLYSFCGLYAQDDHLEPETKISAYTYCDSVVGKRFGKEFEVRFIMSPEFFLMSAFSLEKEKGKPVLKINTVNHWGTIRNPGFYKIRIDTLYASALKQLIHQALAHINFGEGQYGPGGTNYYFVQPRNNGDLRIGWKWSPRPFTRMDQLTNLCQAICRAKKKSQLPSVEKLKELTEELWLYKQNYSYYPLKINKLLDLTREEREAPYYAPATKGITDYLMQQIQYPDSLLQADRWGEVECTLSIDTDGHVYEEDYWSSHPLFEEEAKRIVHSMGAWVPAQKNGKNVRGRAVFYIPFNPEAYRKKMEKQR